MFDECHQRNNIRTTGPTLEKILRSESRRSRCSDRHMHQEESYLRRSTTIKSFVVRTITDKLRSHKSAGSTYTSSQTDGKDLFVDKKLVLISQFHPIIILKTLICTLGPWNMMKRNIRDYPLTTIYLHAGTTGEDQVCLGS